MSTHKQPPEPLQADTAEAMVLKQKVWNRLWRDNEHFMAVIVGREGSGKSHTGIKLAEVVDPTFTAERVMFDPKNFLEHLQTWKEDNETQGKMVVIDEAGVGLGVRTWYDKDQILLNQVLQLIRDENMGVLFTLPRLEELDSQTEGRLHAFIELVQKNEGEYVKLKWLDWDPTRDGRNKNYREYPEMEIGDTRRKVERLCISPPSAEVIEEYEQRKNEFQAQEYANAIEQMEDDVDEERTVKEIAMEVADGKMDAYVGVHSQNGQPYINKDLLRAEYELSHADANAVKSLLDRQFSSEELMDYA